MRCGHLFNRSFDPKSISYSPGYENALDHSPRFRDYATELANGVIERCGLYDKDIVEIACGQGSFIRLLCELGGNRGLGIDPSYRGDLLALDGRLQFVSGFYDDSFKGCPLDLLCCRHALEHLDTPLTFLRHIRRTLSDNEQAHVFFEVPNSLYTLGELGIWDIIYEHVSYFCASSLRRVFELAGFDVLDVVETFDGQFLTILARPDPKSLQENDHPALCASMDGHLARFKSRYEAKVNTWSERLGSLSRSGKHVVVWGGGSKGVTFLNVLPTEDSIEYVVDLNPLKHGHFVPGSGQQFIPPDALRNYRPDVVVVMNPIYANEIQRALDEMRLQSEVMLA